MGSSQSNIESLQRKNAAQSNDIINICNHIINEATAMGWNTQDNTVLCSRITFLTGQTLDWASDENLRRAGIRLGLTFPENDQNRPFFEKEREQICSYIFYYFGLKVQVAEYIRDNLKSLCQDTIESIPHIFPTILYGSSSAVQSEALKRLEEATKGINNWYTELIRLLKIMIQPIDINDLKRLITSIVQLMNNGLRGCCTAMYNLRDFMWYETTDQEGQTYWYNPYALPGEMSSSWSIPIVGSRPQGLSPRVSMINTPCSQQVIPLRIDL